MVVKPKKESPDSYGLGMGQHGPDHQSTLWTGAPIRTYEHDCQQVDVGSQNGTGAAAALWLPLPDQRFEPCRFQRQVRAP
jgi:hypothetical protein